MIDACTARYVERGGMEAEQAVEVACCMSIDFYNSPNDYEDPIKTADEDMSYWTDDGD